MAVGHTVSSKSWAYIRWASVSCFLLDRQEIVRADSRACANTGKRIAARIAIMAITTRSSMRVKPCLHDLADIAVAFLSMLETKHRMKWVSSARTLLRRDVEVYLSRSADGVIANEA